MTVQVDSTTLLDDDTDQANPLTLGDIASGNFLEVEAIKVGDALVATQVRRDEQDDNRLQGPVDSFNAGVDITLLGITFGTAGAEFENQNNSAISAQRSSSASCRSVTWSRSRIGRTADGVADKVEFEQEDALDGEEFDDDSDDNCDQAVDGSDDDCGSDDDNDSEDDCVTSDTGSDDDCATDGGDGSDDSCDEGTDSNGDCATDGGDGSDDSCDNPDPVSGDCATDDGDDSGDGEPTEVEN